MNRVPTRSVALSMLLALATLLAACGSPAPVASPATVDEAVGNAAEGLSAAFADISSDDAATALSALPPLDFAPGLLATLRRGAALQRGLDLFQVIVEELPRGHWVYGPGGWTQVSPTTSPGDLKLEWPVATAGGGSTTATVVVDWEDPGATEIVTSPAGTSKIEAPTDASGTMTVGDLTAATADLLVDWADGAPCGVEGAVQATPDGATFDGSFGIGSTVEFDRVTYAITSSDVGTSGRVAATTPSGSGEVAWNVSLTVPVTRDGSDCEVVLGELTAASIDVSVASASGGVSESFRFVLAIDELVTDTTGNLVSVDVDGRLELNGRIAITFVGTLDDADMDGIPGENVTLTYADGSSESLEAFLERNFGADAALPPMPLRGLAALLR